MIRVGQLRPGMQIPSENEIIRKYAVSNTAAGKIHQEIESAGWNGNESCQSANSKE